MEPDKSKLRDRKIAPLIDFQQQASFPYLQQKNFCSFACLWHDRHLPKPKAENQIIIQDRGTAKTVSSKFWKTTRKKTGNLDQFYDILQLLQYTNWGNLLDLNSRCTLYISVHPKQMYPIPQKILWMELKFDGWAFFFLLRSPHIWKIITASACTFHEFISLIVIISHLISLLCYEPWHPHDLMVNIHIC